MIGDVREYIEVEAQAWCDACQREVHPYGWRRTMRGGRRILLCKLCATTTVCGYCHARVYEHAYIKHDITAHNGLARVREDHEQICRWGGVERPCTCRLAEYEEVAREVIP